MTMFSRDGMYAWATDLADTAHGVLMGWYEIEQYEGVPTVFTLPELLESVKRDWPNATIEELDAALDALNCDTRRGVKIGEFGVYDNRVFIVLDPGKELQEYEETE